MNARLIHLRVKIKSLAAEAVIIRQEARKTRGEIKQGLNEHKKDVVRTHARHNLLAYGLLRGVHYSDIEAKCYEEPDFSKIITLAKRFGGWSDIIDPWIEDARAYLKKQRRANYGNEET
jgi:hypothetical protein